MITKSQRMRLMVYVESMGETINACRIIVKNLKGRDYCENLGIGGRIILKWILMKNDMEMWTGLIWLRRSTSWGLL
jgi:hypothetical protein